MDPVSTRRLVRFTPPGAQPLEGQSSAPVYLLRVPSLLERSEIEACVVGAGVRPIGSDVIRTTLRAAIQRCIVDPAPYEEAMDRQDAGETDTQDQALLHDAELQVSRDPQYARLIQMRLRWEPYIQWYSLRHLLHGVENCSVEICREQSGMVTDACIEELPREHIDLVAQRSLELLSVRAEEKKGSGSPSP